MDRFSADGSQLLLVGPDHSVWLWDFTGIASTEVRVRPAASLESSAYSPDRAMSVSIRGRQATVAAPGFHSGVLDHLQSLRRALFSVNQHYVLTETSDLRCWIWDPVSGTLMAPARSVRYDVEAGECADVPLPTEDRDLRTLSRLAALLGGRQFDRGGVPKSVSLEERKQLFRELAEAYPAEFSAVPGARLRWHQVHATKCEQEREWEAAVFHWERLLSLQSQERLRGDPPGPSLLSDPRKGAVRDADSLSSRLAFARRARDQEQAAVRAGRSRRSVIAPRPEWAASAMLDLSSFYTQSLTEDVTPARRENWFRRLPGGVQTLSGIGFDVHGLGWDECGSRVP